MFKLFILLLQNFNRIRKLFYLSMAILNISGIFSYLYFFFKLVRYLKNFGIFDKIFLDCLNNPLIIPFLDSINKAIKKLKEEVSMGNTPLPSKEALLLRLLEDIMPGNERIKLILERYEQKVKEMEKIQEVVKASTDNIVMKEALWMIMIALLLLRDILDEMKSESERDPYSLTIKDVLLVIMIAQGLLKDIQKGIKNDSNNQKFNEDD